MRDILIIEDEEKHIKDAKNYFSRLDGLKLYYSNNYLDAHEIILKKKLDGVISDVFFPLSGLGRYSQMEPIGVRLAIELTQKKIPFVLNTSMHHHSERLEWLSGLARSQNWDIIDSAEPEEYDNVAESKNWERAYKTLVSKMK